LSSGSQPLKSVHRRANNNGEHHTKPTTIVASALTHTAHTFASMNLIENLREQTGIGQLQPATNADCQGAYECDWNEKKSPVLGNTTLFVCRHLVK
jgi:hypothetical protein